ncbi:MAG: hypothetical protein PHI23_01705 [Candidatus Peribacteraceae bacterium]|nr:hypothetical protein [Candidatus Peribacteraceae bacterium]
MRVFQFLRREALAIPLSLAIVVGVILRFLALDAMEFKADEFNAFALAAAYLQHGSLPQVGLQSSTGLFNPPFFLVLLWPALLFRVDPLFVTGWIVLLNAAGILGLFLFLRRLGGLTCALPATAVVASAPWLFILSRKIWAQDALFPFLILMGWLLISYARDRRPWHLWGAAASIALLTQLHMSTWVVPIAVALWLAILRIRPRWRDMVIVIAVFLILYLPYIAFHVQDGFENLTHTTTQNAGSILHQLRWMVGINGAVGLDYIWGPVRPAAIPSWLPGAAGAGTWFLGIGAVAGLFLSMKHILSSSSRLRFPQHLSALDQYVLLLLCIALLSFLNYLVMGVPAFPHYHLVFLPLLPLLCSLALMMLPKRISLLATLLLAIIVSVFLVLVLYFLTVITDHPDQLNGDYGTPYRNAQDHWIPYIDAVRKGQVRLPKG